MTAPAIPPIQIEVTLSLELHPHEVWPDKNVPDDWSAADVLARVKESGSFRNFNNEWDADLFGAQVLVMARGRYERGTLR